MKKLLSVILMIAVLFSAMPFSSAEEVKNETYISGEWYYRLRDDGTAAVCRYKGRDKKVVIPAELDGISVTGIEPGTFVLCDFVRSVTIPDSVTGIERNPFHMNEWLTDIIVSPDHPYLATIGGVLFSKPDKRLICYPGGLSAASYTVPQGIQAIEDIAFSGCGSLVSVTVSDGVTGIGDWAFIGCSSLASVTIPDSITNIGLNPFRECIKLTDIIVSPDHPYLAVIDGILFSRPDKRLVCCPCARTAECCEIPQGIHVIGDFAFSWCESLASVTIPDGVTSIGDHAFSGCSSLASVTIPDSMTGIGDDAFLGCNSLTSVTVPDSVTSIGKGAFDTGSFPVSNKVPGSVIRARERASAGCEPLTVTVFRGSYAEKYCGENGIRYTYPDADP